MTAAPLDLDALEAAEKAATRGPWKTFNLNGVVSVMKGSDEVIQWTGFDGSDFRNKAASNADLIVALRNAAPALFAAARKGLQPEAEWLDASTLVNAGLNAQRSAPSRRPRRTRQARAALGKPSVTSTSDPSPN